MPDNSLPKPVPPAKQVTKQPVQQAINQSDQEGKNQASAGQMPPSALVKSSQPLQSPLQPQQSVQPNQPTQPSQPMQPTPVQPAPSQPTQPTFSQPVQPASSQPTQPAPSQKSLAESPQVGVGQSKKSVQSGKSDQQKKGHGKKQSKKANKPQLAQVKSSPFKYIPYLVGLLFLIGASFFVWKRFFGSSTQPVAETPAGSEQTPAVRKKVPAQQITLNYWGLWEPSNVLSEVLADFESQHEGVSVNYSKQSHQDYRERLQTAIASGNGPDIFRYHASWVPMLAEELTSLPQSIMTASEYKQTFYPVATKMLSFKGQIVGIPLMYEGLGLYYNKEMLETADAEPPKSWAELKTLANKLTVKQGSTIKRGGLAIGNASNVEHFADILALLMLQNGADLTAPTSQEAEDALIFYTNFIKQNPVWSDELPSSTVAFARGDTAMMLAPSWRAHEVMEMNPELKFGITTVPKLGETRLSWASFWAEGVSSKSSNQDMAWKFLKYLSSKEVQQKLYSAQSQIRSFGELYSRRDLADELAGNEMVAPFLEDAVDARGWYLSSYTHDNGINDLLIKYYEDAINEVLSGSGAGEALQTVDQGTRQVLRQYGVNAGSVN